MSIAPTYKIEVYDPTLTLRYTITSDVLQVQYKDVITEGVGTFNLILTTEKGDSTFLYNDISLHDTVKIYLGYGTVDANPDFVGKVSSISAPSSTASGFVRQIGGLSQGEILLRRLKTNKDYTAIGASTIVTELANDLGLGTTQIEADATSLTLQIKTKTYFDVLRDISDFWASAGTQIKKDFYVDISNNLVWKSRPLRTTGVETLTVGEKVSNYEVNRQITEVKNKIYVYGAREAALPTDKDAWTEVLTNWTSNESLELAGSGAEKVGSYCVRGYKVDPAGAFTITMKHSLTTEEKIRLSLGPDSLSFWVTPTMYLLTSLKLRLYAPDTSNYFETDITPTVADWILHDIALGHSEIYSASNTTKPWTITGSPSWFHIESLEFIGSWSGGGTGTWVINVDGLYFFPKSYYSLVQDATSQTSYGIREMQYAFDQLKSDSECEQRGQTLQYQLKDPPTEISIKTDGNKNVKAGDRIPMTIPAENIVNANYDVINVTQTLFPKISEGWQTLATMVNSVNIREPLETTRSRNIIKLRQRTYQLSLEAKTIG